MRRIVFTLMLMLPLVSLAQQRVETKIPLSYRLGQFDFAPDEPTHLFLKGSEAELRSVVDTLNGHFKYMRGHYAAVILRFDQVALLDDFDQVQAVHFELAKGQTLLSKSRFHTRTNRVHEGTAGLADAYSGASVIVGIIDAGIDLQHPDFHNVDSTTRILELWDHNMGFHPQRTPAYGYGQVFDSADINAGNCPHVDQASQYGHGTNTAGIAVGNGRSAAEFVGHAPEADIIIVSSNFNASGWTSTVADAVDYIFERAEFYGKPCVINASIGTYPGSHDGRDVASTLIAEKINEKPGRIMVCAAGNSGEYEPYHLGYEAGQDTNFTWFKTQNNAAPGSGVVSFYVFGDVGDFESLKFSIGADRVNPNYQFAGALAFDSVESYLNLWTVQNLYGSNGNYLGQVHMQADTLNGTYELYVAVIAIDSVDYLYRFMATGSGRLDIWSGNNGITGGSDMIYENLPTSAQFPEIVKYKTPDKKQSIVSSWACSDKVITVGNFTNRTSYINYNQIPTTYPNLIEGNIGGSSSAGPSRLGHVKPEVAAPGELTLAAGAAFQITAQLNNQQADRVASSGMHNRATGTSAASPVVAGIAALFLEMCPNANWQDFKTALIDGAKEDQFTSVTPNDRWGYGKADAMNTLSFHKPIPKLSYVDNEFCDGEALALSASPSYLNMEWTTGELAPTIQVTEGGIYFLAATSDLGCLGYSDTVVMYKRPLPEKPQIQVVGQNPSCSNEVLMLHVEDIFGAYEWSSGQHTNEINVENSGEYICQVKNIHGCVNSSDPVNVSFYPTHAEPQLYLQVGDILSIESDSLNISEYKWFFNRVQISDQDDSIYTVDSPGVYSGSLVDENGCEWRSNEIFIGALGHLSPDESEQVKIYPNPFSEKIRVEFFEENIEWELLSVTGQIVMHGNSEETSFEIQTQAATKGIYLLHLSTRTQESFLTLIKQ